MKVGLLAGGQGTRLGDTGGLHKGMVPIGGKPILEHIMRYYAHFEHRDFVIALGHHSQSIVDWVAALDEPWTIRLVDTGLDTETGGRIKRLAPYLDGTFMLTWCDGLADVGLDALLEFHKDHGRMATVTAVHPPPRFGRLKLVGARVDQFEEKAIDTKEWINGAFFVIEPELLDYIERDQTSFERETLPKLAAAGQLMAYRHQGFWQCMDTLKEAEELNRLWQSGAAPWGVS